MYQALEGQRFINKNYDWMQLGWLAVWAEYKHLDNYHQMKYESLPSNLKEDQFIKGLLTKGLSLYNLCMMKCSSE